MTKRKAKKQEELPEEPTTFDRLSDAADRLFGEAFASIPEQIADKMNPPVPDVPEAKSEPETDEVDAEE